MFIGKYTKFLPYWKYYLSNKITYREFFDERVYIWSGHQKENHMAESKDFS